MAGFLQALPVILEFEGGRTVDTGGLTYQGVTQAVFDAWNKANNQPTGPVTSMKEDVRDAIYYKNYWIAARCDALPWPISMAHFDLAVNGGVGRAIKTLQAAVGAKADGVWGEETKTKVQLAMHDPEGLAERMFWHRVEFYYALASQENKTYGPYFLGWMRRVIKLRRKMWEAW